MSESRSLFGDCHETAYIWQRYKHFTMFSGFVLFESAASTMQKINPVDCFNLVTEGLFIYIYFLLSEENHQNRISRAGEKVSPTISLSFRKNDCLELKFSINYFH